MKVFNTKGTFSPSESEREGEFFLFDVCRCLMGIINWILCEANLTRNSVAPIVEENYRFRISVFAGCKHAL